MCHSLMIIQGGHGYMFSKLMPCVDLRGFNLSWKIRQIGRLRCPESITGASFVLHSLIRFSRRMTLNYLRQFHILLNRVELQNRQTRN